MLRASLSVGILLALLGFAGVPAGADSGGGSGSADPATSVYTEEIPAAGGTSGKGSNGAAAPSDAATSVYTEQIPAAGGTASGSSTRPSARNLEQLLTSPTLGAPDRVQPLRGNSADTTYGTFSFQTVREVAGIGTARLAGLLAVLVLISAALGAAALLRFARR